MGIIQESVANELQRQAELARKKVEEYQQSHKDAEVKEEKEPAQEQTLVQDYAPLSDVIPAEVMVGDAAPAEAPKKRGGRPKRSKK